MLDAKVLLYSCGITGSGVSRFFRGSTGMEIALHDALCSSLRHALAETSAQEHVI